MYTEKKQLCNNCGSYGHIYYHCKRPITSLGIICYRINPIKKKKEYLLIQRKDSLGYVDFLRGKYSEYNDYQLKNIIKEMTINEIDNILNYSYKELWDKLWNKITEKYDLKNEEKFIYVKKFKKDLFNLANKWTEPEWGFPKGRRSFKEKDIECALREFEEETGYLRTNINLIKNLNPFEEIFTGSNLKSYKHKYFLAKISYDYSLNDKNFQKSEIGNMIWCELDEAIYKIRPYNIEKIELLTNVHNLLEKTIIF
jgi:8-oxo-dGTP pyrophosphatase MutT (NUDIX family)